MSESDIQSNIMALLLLHHRVAWAMVITTGVFKVKGGCITVGHYISDNERQKTGMSDIIGQMRDGRMLAIETKKPGEEPTIKQYNFLSLVNDNGGLGFWANSIEMVSRSLKL